MNSWGRYIGSLGVLLYLIVFIGIPADGATVDSSVDLLSYLGGSDDDWIYGIEVDRDGNIYVAGKTYSYDFPCLPSSGTKRGLYDAFVAKLDPEGRILYSYCIGGSGNDWAMDIALDGHGDIYITGVTSSKDFPLLNPYQDHFGGGLFDAFILKMDGSSGRPLYATCLGGKDDDRGHAIVVDGKGNAFVTGRTFSKDLSSMLFKASDGWDLFIAGLSPSGRLQYFTYLGGKGYDVGNDMAIDRNGLLYIVGATTSQDFPSCNGNRGWDAFVLKFDPERGPIYSTCIGGGGADGGFGIFVDDSGRAYVTGRTSSPDFPLSFPFQEGLEGMMDAFILVLDRAGKPIYSTYLGGEGVDWGYSILFDGTYIHVSGMTSSADFQGLSSQSFGGLYDIFYVKVLPDGSRPLISRYLVMGKGEDRPFDMVLHRGELLIGGYTFSPDLPSKRPYGGEGDGLILRIKGVKE